MSTIEKLRDLRPKSIILFETSHDQNQIEIIAELLKLLRDNKGVYVSSNMPTSDLIEKLQIHNFDLKTALEAANVYVVDLVSRSVGATDVKGGIYVSSPSELSATQMAIEKALEHIEGEAGQTWLLLDSISTLLVYNSPGALLQFLHFLIGRLRVLHFSGLIFTIQGSVDMKVFLTVRQFCDMVIKL